MISGLHSLLRDNAAPSPASVPVGVRIYAIGDIHGRLDLFAALASAIDADDGARPAADTTVILLGDLVDRGPESAGVIDHAMRWARERRVRLIAGNHEEMFLDALENAETLRHFIRIGGRETILSYGITPARFQLSTIGELGEMLRAAVPAEHVRYLAAGEDMIRIGGYLFAHAGLKPGVGIEAQRKGDLRWIREPFLSSAANHGAVVVHGHTIVDEPDFRPNRIGIDTGAFASGRLTALRLEGQKRWIIEAMEQQGTIETCVYPA
jgi:serine/threonine protein phosphatase 1